MNHSKALILHGRLVVALLFSIIALAACGGSSSSSVITLTAWAGDEGTLPQLITQFNASHKDIQIKLQPVSGPQGYEPTVLTKLATGAKPDILTYQTGTGIQQLNPAKNLLDLSGMPTFHNYVSPIMANTGVYQGKHYAVELAYVSLFTSWYNKPIFAKYHLTVPTTFQQLLDTCKTLKQVAPDVAPIYMGAGDKWPMQILPFNMLDDAVGQGLEAKLNTGSAHFTDPQIVTALSTLDTLNKNGCFEQNVVTGTYTGEQKALMTGTGAMVFNGSWMISDILKSGYSTDQIDQTIGNMPVSLNDENIGVGTPASVYLPNTGNSAKEAAARTFLTWATGPQGYADYLKDSGNFPVFKGYAAPSNLLGPLKEANAAFQKHSVLSFGSTLQASYGDWTTWLQQIVLHQQTPEQVAALMDQAFRQDAHTKGVKGF